MSDIDMFIDAAPVSMEVGGAQGPAGEGLTGEINHLAFDPTPTGVPTTEGTVSWNSDDHTLNLQTDIAGVVQQVGQEQHIRVRNTTGVTIQNGSVVYLSGASGQRPLVALADADNDAHVLSTIGVATADIDHNAFGYVTTSGLVRGVNTNGMTEGNAIYLSTTAGAFTQSVPTGNKVRVGWCIVAGNSGTILVHVDKQSIKAADLIETLPVASGGTGATTAADARTSLGLGTVATLSSVSLTTNVSGTLPVANGGTNATTAAGARTSLAVAGSQTRARTTNSSARNTGNTGTTFTVDDVIAGFEVLANKSYLMIINLHTNSGASVGAKAQITIPSSAYASTVVAGIILRAGSAAGGSQTSSVVSLGGITTSNVYWTGTVPIRTGSSGGTVNLEWALNASAAGDVQLLTGSYITLIELN